VTKRPLTLCALKCYTNLIFITLFCSYSLISGVLQLVALLQSGLQTEIFYVFRCVSLVCFVSQVYCLGIFCLVIFLSVIFPFLCPNMYLGKTEVLTAVSLPESFGICQRDRHIPLFWRNLLPPCFISLRVS